MHSGTFLQQLRKVKGFEYIKHSKQSTHHKRLHVPFTVSSERLNYTYTLWLGSTHFPKHLKPFQKQMCQKS